jgi:hypothetical protein
VNEARNEFELAERRRVIAELYLDGKSTREIGAIVGLSHVTVGRHLVWIRNRWLKDAERDVALRRMEEVKHLESIRRKALREWEQSCQPRRKTRKQVTRGRMKRDGIKMPDLLRWEDRTEECRGDPRYLEVAIRCGMQICALMGIDTTTASPNTAVTVIGNVDLDVIIGKKKLPREQPAGRVIDNPPLLEDTHAHGSEESPPPARLPGLADGGAGSVGGVQPPEEPRTPDL